MSRVPWATLSETVVEDMIAVLLSQLYCQPGSEARRIDGKGGDGGRDVQIETPLGIRAFEIKSFAGRMDKGRRAQVQSSLARASTLQPLDWTLLAPIDPTPGELQWFESLRVNVPFPIEWRGLTWLDAQLAQHPSITRYYLEDIKAELVDLARLLHQEEAALVGGAPDAMERARRLAEHANELDPFYRFEITSDGDRASIKVIPRYQGAERDSPIVGEFTFAFPFDEAGKKAAEEFQHALDFGTGVTIPTEYIRAAQLKAPASLGGDLSIQAIQLFPSSPSDEPREMLLAILDAAGITIGELPITLRVINRGQRGALIEGADRTGVVSIAITMVSQEHTFSVRIRMQARAFFASEMRSVVRCLVAFSRPNQLALRTMNGGELGRSLIDLDEPLLDPQFAQFVDDLALVQWASGMNRQVGPDFSEEDLMSIWSGALLLRGEQLEATWDRMVFVVGGSATDEFRRTALGGEFPCRLTVAEPHTVVIGGVEYPIGKTKQYDIQAARLEVVEESWRTAGTIPDGAELTLVPGATDRALMTLLA